MIHGHKKQFSRFKALFVRRGGLSFHHGPKVVCNVYLSICQRKSNTRCEVESLLSHTLLSHTKSEEEQSAFFSEFRHWQKLLFFPLFLQAQNGFTSSFVCVLRPAKKTPLVDLHTQGYNSHTHYVSFDQKTCGVNNAVLSAENITYVPNSHLCLFKTSKTRFSKLPAARFRQSNQI